MRMTTSRTSLMLGIVVAFGPLLTAQEADVGIDTYAGLTVTGEVGKVYSIEYSSDLESAVWRCLEYLQLPVSPWRGQSEN